MTRIVKSYLENLRLSPFFFMISKRFTSLFCANLSLSSNTHLSSEIFILLKSKMIFSACSLAFLKLFSIVLLLLPLGHLISHETPSINMSGVCTFGLFRGAVTCSPTYALRLRGGGFSFKTGCPVSISELSPCAPRFFCFFLSCAPAQFLLQKVSSLFPDVDCSVDIAVVVLQAVLAKPLTHIQSLHLRVDRPAP